MIAQEALPALRRWLFRSLRGTERHSDPGEQPIASTDGGVLFLFVPATCQTRSQGSKVKVTFGRDRLVFARAFLMRQVDRDVLPLRVALEHAFEGELAADAAFFVTAVGMTWALTEALVHLNPTSLDRVCRAQSPADVMRPDVGGEPVMAVIRHANHVRLVPMSLVSSSGPLRGRQCAAHPCSKVVRTQSLGSQACEAKRATQSQGCRGSKTCRHSASHVDR